MSGGMGPAACETKVSIGAQRVKIYKLYPPNLSFKAVKAKLVKPSIGEFYPP